MATEEPRTCPAPKPLRRIAREAGLPRLDLIRDDWDFLHKVYELARRLEADPRTSPRQRLAFDCYASVALCRMAEIAEREDRA